MGKGVGRAVEASPAFLSEKFRSQLRRDISDDAGRWLDGVRRLRGVQEEKVAGAQGERDVVCSYVQDTVDVVALTCQRGDGNVEEAVARLDDAVVRPLDAAAVGEAVVRAAGVREKAVLRSSPLEGLKPVGAQRAADTRSQGPTVGPAETGRRSAARARVVAVAAARWRWCAAAQSGAAWRRPAARRRSGVGAGGGRGGVGRSCWRRGRRGGRRLEGGREGRVGAPPSAVAAAASEGAEGAAEQQSQP